MKFLVLAACIASTTAQGFYGLQTHPNGAVTPLDEPRVAAAKAEHLATKYGVYADEGYAAHTLSYPAVNTAYASTVVPTIAYNSYNGPIHIPTLVAHPNGAVTPADEPAVQAARSEHLAAYGGVYGGVYGASSGVYAAPYGYEQSFYGLVAHPNGAVVPVDEPAVQAARAEHLNAKGVYGGVYGASAGVYAAPYEYEQSFYGLVAHPNGAVVPVDEPAVQAARAEHLNAKAAYGH